MSGLFKKLRTREGLWRYAYYVLPALLLTLAAVYGSWHANLYFSNVQDAILYPYLFQDFQLHNIVVPAQHANFVKFPLFWLQAVLPYNFVTLSIVNILLPTVSILLWAFLLVRIFGKRYAPLICLVLAGFIFASPSFNTNFTETTIRNIEYPIGLAFVLLINRLLQNRGFSRLQVIISVIISGLFALSIAGDSLILYAFSVPLLLILGLSWVQNNKLAKHWWRAVLITVGVTLGGLILRKVIFYSGIVNAFDNPQFGGGIIPFDALSLSVGHAFSQLINLSGGNIFAQNTSPHILLYALNLVVLIVGFLGIIVALVYYLRELYRKKSLVQDNRFVMLVLSACFLTTFVAYIASNLVLSKQPDGSYVDGAQIRYISLLPLLLSVGVIFFLERYYKKRTDFLVILSVALVVGMVLAIPIVRQSWASNDSTAYTTRDFIKNIADDLEDEKVEVFASGDTLGAPVKFASSGELTYFSMYNCGQAFPYNTTNRWRTPMKGDIDSAIVIDVSGVDGLYWGGCNLAQIEQKYGKPSKIESVANPRGSKPVEIWFYDYDIRYKL